MRILAPRELTTPILFSFILLLCASVSPAWESSGPAPRSSDPEGMHADSSAAHLFPRASSIIEVRGTHGLPAVHWLLPPAEPFLPGVGVVGPGLFRLLEASGAELRVLAPYDQTQLYYLVEAKPSLSERAVAEAGRIIWQNGESYLLSVEPGSEKGLACLLFRTLPLHPTLATPGDSPDGAPCCSDQGLAVPPYSSSERFWMERMVASVSQENLLRDVNSLSGEMPVNLSTGWHTIRSRYVRHSDCLRAAEYLYSQFDSMGVDVAYDHFFGTPVRCVEFIGTRGYAVGNGGFVCRSEDGGATWEKQDSGVKTHLWKSSFASRDTGCVVGMFGTVLKTADGGFSWRSTGPGIRSTLYGVEFLNSSTGWVCGDRALIYRTDDGGLSWTKQPVPAGLSEDDILYDIAFTDPSNGWAVSNYGTVLHTSDGGLSWELQERSVFEDLYDVCFWNSRNGWAVGWRGTIIHTENGGASWEVQMSGVVDPLTSVWFADSLNGWAVGWRGLVLATRDGGAHWTRQQSGIASDLYSVCFTDENRGWAIGAVSLVGTLDGGAHWVSLNGGVPGAWANVVATLPGTKTPSKTYVVCGHYDSTSDNPMVSAPGADDNASGTSLVLEAARVLSDYGFESTIKFICLSAEELIYWSGSRHYASCARARGEEIVAALNFDMIAWGSHALYLIGNRASSWLVDHCAAAGSDFVPGLPLTELIDDRVRFSDHANFWNYDYDALCGIELDHEANPNWHTTHDVVRNLNMPLAADVTRLAIASLASMARLTTTPKVVATVDVEPNALNLKSHGQHVTCYVELPAEHRVSDVDVSTVVLNGVVEAESRWAVVGDHDADGIPDLVLKFARNRVQEVLEPGDGVEVTLTGQISDFVFEGKDTIRVMGQRDYRLTAGEPDARVGAKSVCSGADPPGAYRLLQNYPQPFNPVTIIQYELPVASHVCVEVFDIAGRLVRTLVNERRPAGVHAVVWRGEDDTGRLVTSGVYVYRITTRDFTDTKKMTLLR